MHNITGQLTLKEEHVTREVRRRISWRSLRSSDVTARSQTWKHDVRKTWACWRKTQRRKSDVIRDVIIIMHTKFHLSHSKSKPFPLKLADHQYQHRQNTNFYPTKYKFLSFLTWLRIFRFSDSRRAVALGSSVSPCASMTQTRNSANRACFSRSNTSATERSNSLRHFKFSSSSVSCWN